MAPSFPEGTLAPGQRPKAWPPSRDSTEPAPLRAGLWTLEAQYHSSAPAMPSATARPAASSWALPHGWTAAWPCLQPQHQSQWVFRSLSAGRGVSRVPPTLQARGTQPSPPQGWGVDALRLQPCCPGDSSQKSPGESRPTLRASSVDTLKSGLRAGARGGGFPVWLLGAKRGDADRSFRPGHHGSPLRPRGNGAAPQESSPSHCMEPTWAP